MEKNLKSTSGSNLLITLSLFFSYFLMLITTNSIFGRPSSLSLAEKLTFHSVATSLSLGLSYFILPFGSLHVFIRLFEKKISQREIFSFLSYAAFIPYISLQSILLAIFPKLEMFSNPSQVIGFFQGLCFAIIGFQIFHWLKQRLLFSTRQAITIIIFVAAVFLGFRLFLEHFYQVSFSFFPRL